MSATPVFPNCWAEQGNWPWTGCAAVFTPDQEVLAGGWLEGDWCLGIERVGPRRHVLSRVFDDAGALVEVAIAGPPDARPGWIRLSYDDQGRLIGYQERRASSGFRLTYDYGANGEVEFEHAFRRVKGADQLFGSARRFHGPDGELMRIEVCDRIGRVRETRSYLAEGRFAEARSFNNIGECWSTESTEFQTDGRFLERRSTYYDTSFDPPRPIVQWVEIMTYDRETRLPVECRIVKSRPSGLDAQGQTAWRVRVSELIRFNAKDDRPQSDETRYFHLHGGEHQRIALTFDYDRAGRLEYHRTEETDLRTGRAESRIVWRDPVPAFVT